MNFNYYFFPIAYKTKLTINSENARILKCVGGEKDILDELTQINNDYEENEPKHLGKKTKRENKEMYKNGDYDQMLKLLSDSENKLVKVIFTYKGDKIEAFEIDLNSLSSVFKDDRFLKLELMGWGFISEKEHLDEYENRSSSNAENSDEIKITEA